MKRTLFFLLILVALLTGLLAVGVSANSADVCKIGDVGFGSLSDAIAKFQEGDVITLLADIENVEITQPVTLDLNGCNATITAEPGLVTVLDSRTDDYDVTDGVYGKLTGNATAAEGYLAVAEADGVSYHKISLEITAMSLRASVAGIYYKSNFQADAVAAAQIARYGVALNIKEAPNAENMGTTSAYSAYKNFTSGQANGTLLKNIMKASNTDRNNLRNANCPIYGAPYILTADGQYIFGETVQRSLVAQFEAIDKNWSSYSNAAQGGVLWMHKLYKNVTAKWDIPNINRETGPKQYFKVLTIGHSLSVDSNHMLALIANAEGYAGLEVGTLYYSGCSLARHVQYMQEGTDAYNLYISSSDSVSAPPTILQKVTMKEGVCYQEWDLIILQGGMFELAKDETFTDGNIQLLQNFVNEHKLNKKANFAWNMPLAFATDPDLVAKYPSSTNNPYITGYVPYNNDRLALYNDFSSAIVRNIVPDTTFQFVIPTGTAVENAISAYSTEKGIMRDFAHLTDLGRVIAAYTWYCRIANVDHLDDLALTTVPLNYLNTNKSIGTDWTLTEAEQKLVLEAVNNALQQPFQKTQSQYTMN